MRKPLVIGVVVLVLIASSFVAYLRITHKEPGASSEAIASFTSCGCGGCGSQTPRVEEVFGKYKYNQIRDQLLKNPPSAAACETMGCSICVEYRLVAV